MGGGSAPAKFRRTTFKPSQKNVVWSSERKYGFQFVFLQITWKISFKKLINLKIHHWYVDIKGKQENKNLNDKGGLGASSQSGGGGGIQQESTEGGKINYTSECRWSTFAIYMASIKTGTQKSSKNTKTMMSSKKQQQKKNHSDLSVNENSCILKEIIFKFDRINGMTSCALL